MVQGYLTPKQQRLDLATIDEFAAQYGEYPVCYRIDRDWFHFATLDTGVDILSVC